MSYKIKHYQGNEISRFVLGTEGIKTLFVIGLNPSTADDKTPDLTIKKIISFANDNEFDSFLMLNLYAQRTPHPDELHEKLNQGLHNKNIRHILKLIKSKNTNIFILAAWGEKIKKRKYLFGCLKDIYNETIRYKIKWLKIGELTNSGHPRHPSRTPYAYKFTRFDIMAYLNKY